MTPDTTIETSSKYEILKEVVKDYPGLLSATEPLIQELNNHPKNSAFIVKEMRSYALKNFYLHDHHEKGTEAIAVIIDVFLDAINAPEMSVQQAAIDGLIFYLEKILMDGDQNLQKYTSIFQDCFDRLYHLEEKQFLFLISNPHQLKKLGQIFFDRRPADFRIESFNNLLFRYLMTTYEYWLQEEDPVTWFQQGTDYHISEEDYKKLTAFLYPVSHANLKGFIEHLLSVEKSPDQYQHLGELLKLPGYMQLVRFYEDLVRTFSQDDHMRKSLHLLMVYLFKILEIKGLSGIHENTLREINRTLSTLIRTERHEQIKVVLSEACEALKRGLGEYPETVLSCIQNIGNEIFKLGDSKLVEWFIQKIISLGFQYPQIEGVTVEWQIKSNRAHLKNIRVWLELIENDPKWSKSLISALIIHLRLAGVYINDTDLFQKDITKLLNSDIKPVYHLVKQLCKLFPVYFSEINAEGSARLTTYSVLPSCDYDR